MVSDRDSTPYVSFTSDNIRKFVNSPELNQRERNELLQWLNGEKRFPICLPRLDIIIDNEQRNRVAIYDNKTLDIRVEQNDRHLCTYSFDLSKREWNVTFSDKVEIDDEDWLKNHGRFILIVYEKISFLLLNPKRISRKILREKVKPVKYFARPSECAEESSYSCIKGLVSLVQNTCFTGKGTPHKHEYDVRGHYRHYKNGKVVLVKPHTCCVGRGAKNIHEYEVRS